MAYNTDIEYTDKFYPEWSLSNLRLQCALKGIEMPKIDQACELGFGQGVTLNLLASTSEVSWYGTDFLQVHVDNAKTMAHELDNDVKLYNLSFKDFSEVKNLPKFDLIVLHGIFSWISEENQKVILDFIENRLSDNGLVYISYNARPGSEVFKPAQYLMNQLRLQLSKTLSDPVSQVNHIHAFMQSFHQTSPKYLQTFTGIEQKLQGFKDKDPKYLIHEYFNSDWRSFFFSEIANRMNKLGLSYLSQSRLNDELSAFNFTSDQLKFLKSSKVTGTLEQDLKDAMCNRQFRRDIWIKSPVSMTTESFNQWLQNTFIILTRPISSLDLSIKGLAVSASMDNPLYHGLLKKLKTYKAFSLQSLMSEMQINSSQLLEMLGLLHVNGIVSLCSGDLVNQEKLQKAKRANIFAVEKAMIHQCEAILVLPIAGAFLQIDYWLSLYLHLVWRDELSHEQAVPKMVAFIEAHNVEIKINNKAVELEPFIHGVVKNIETSFLDFLIKHKVIAG